MGEHEVEGAESETRAREFVRALLTDVRALSRMLDEHMFAEGPIRVGLEQEMFLVDAEGRPANVAPAVLRALGPLPDEDGTTFTTELARFNLEANLAPIELDGSFLARLETSLRRAVRTVDHTANAEGATVVLTGILPSLGAANLSLESMSDEPRYRELNRTLLRLRGDDFQIRIEGDDVLDERWGNVMLESANTSLQLHLSVAPSKFASSYNLAQLVSAPLLAVAANSPLLLGRRLWKETRVALFERSVDARSAVDRERGRPTRVCFGDAWAEGILPLAREVATRYPPVLTKAQEPDPLGALDRGEIPRLSAFSLQNGTVWRWNRPCYGITDGVPHLRIENRVLPAGPSVSDEIANAAFYYGMMLGLADEADSIPSRMNFADARRAFTSAAREGIDAQLPWLDGTTMPAHELILTKLLPAARRGLASVGTLEADVERHLDVIAERARSRRTGASWLLAQVGRGRTARDIVVEMTHRCRAGDPVHRWPITGPHGRRPSVSEFMTTDLFTVRPRDVVDLATSMMDWQSVRHIPVEDDEGRIVGLVDHRALVELATRAASAEPIAVVDIMQAPPPTIDATMEFAPALRMLLDSGRSCLAVVENDRLRGIVTESDFLEILAGELNGGAG